MSQAAPVSWGRIILDRFSGIVARAGRKSFWPLMDQALVSAGNFITLVLVARALPVKSEYGAFGLILECIFYLNTLQSALITYPLTVKGTVADLPRQKKLASASMWMTVGISLPVMLIALAIAGLQGSWALGLAAAFALVAWQAQEVVRRTLMAQFRYAAATIGDGLRYLGTAAAIGFLWYLDKNSPHKLLTLANIFFIIGGFATLAIIIQAFQVGLVRIGWRELVDLAKEFWTAGRWMLLTSISAVVVSLCGVWTVSYFHGNEIVGEFYAIGNFMKPVNPLLMTFVALVVQHSAKAYEAHGLAAAKRAALKLAIILGVLTAPYLLALMFAPDTAMILFYGRDSHFRDPQGLLALRIFAFSFFILLAMSMLGAFLNGVHRTRETFYAQIVNSVATIAIAFPMTVKLGLLGQIIGGTIAATIQLGAVIYYVRKAK